MKNSESSNKSFGLVFGLVFIILFLYNLIKFEELNIHFFILSVFFILFAFIYPKIFGPLNKIWIKFGDFLGKIIAPIIMFLVYFTVIFITSIILKIFNKDILDLNINKASKSFWKLKDKKLGDMRKQF
jgi:membrane-associated HD superfamily phosphohydrolase